MKTLLTLLLTMSLVGTSWSQTWTVREMPSQFRAGETRLKAVTNHNVILGQNINKRFGFRVNIPDGTFEVLSLLPDAEYTVANAINDSGTTVGLSTGRKNFFADRPTIWSPSNTAFELNLFPLPTGGSLVSINASGFVLGYYLIRHSDWNEYRYYIWHPRTGSRQLPLLPGFDSQKAIYLTRSGDIVGIAFNHTLYGGLPESVRAVVWTSDGRLLDLGECREVVAANDNLQILIYLRTLRNPVILQPGRPPQILPMLPWSSRFINVYALNNRGLVVGRTSDSIPIAWLSQTRQWVVLPVPANDRFPGKATPQVVNDRGVIVGQYSATDGFSHYVIWEPSPLFGNYQRLR